MRQPIIILFLIFVMAFLLAAGPTSLPMRGPGDFYRLQHSPYLALTSGGEIYIGFVSAKHVGQSVDAHFETGQLEFNVQDTLRGEKANDLTLPYSFQIEPSRSLGIVSWPPVDDLIKRKTQLLIVVIPNLADPVAAPVNNDYGAACNVYAISGPDDPIVAAYRRLLLMDSLKREAVRNALGDEAQSVNSIERQFAEEAAIKQLDVDAGIKIIGLAIQTGSKVKGDPPPDVWTGIDGLSDMADDTDSTDAERLSAQRAIAQLAISANKEIRDDTIQELRDIVEEEKPKPSDLLAAPMDRAALLKAASTATKDPDNEAVRSAAASIISWLNQGQ